MRIERWLAAVWECAALDVTLGREVARMGQLVKGYGDVRRRLVAVVDDLLDHVVRAARLEAGSGCPLEVTTQLARRCRDMVLQGPDAEPRATALARDVVERLTTCDRAATLASLTAS